jgi:hypothetical protein
MVDNVISDLFGFGVERHNRLFENTSLLFNVGFFFVHLSGFALGLSDRVLEHHELFIESSGLVLNVHGSLIKEVLVGLHLLKHSRKVFRDLLLLLGFVSDTRDFRLNL